MKMAKNNWLTSSIIYYVNTSLIFDNEVCILCDENLSPILKHKYERLSRPLGSTILAKSKRGLIFK